MDGTYTSYYKQSEMFYYGSNKIRYNGRVDLRKEEITYRNGVENGPYFECKVFSSFNSSCTSSFNSSCTDLHSNYVNGMMVGDFEKITYSSEYEIDIARGAYKDGENGKKRW